MLGAIAGDCVGSVFEYHNHRELDFPLFSVASRPTDDTILTVASAEALMTDQDFRSAYRRYYAFYSDADYGSMFRQWARGELGDPNEGYGSLGNGAPMRVSPCAWVIPAHEFCFHEPLRLAAESAEATHNHPDAVDAARAVVHGILLGLRGMNPTAIGESLGFAYGYRLDEPIASIREWLDFDETAAGTTPVAIRAFMEATDWESAIRLAVSVGGDTDTICAITGALAESVWGVPEWIADETMSRLDTRIRDVVVRFRERYCGGVVIHESEEGGWI